MSATAQTRDADLVHAYAVAAAQLHQLGATVCDNPLPVGDVARWDSAHATLYLRPDANLEDRVWVLRDLTRAILHGVACADARDVDRVRLVG